MSSTDPGAIAIYIAGRDVADVGVALGATWVSVEAQAGFNMGGVGTFATSQPPGNLGEVVTSPYASANAGKISFRIRIRAATNLIAATVLRQLKAWCTQGDFTFSSSLNPNLYTFVRATDDSEAIDEPWNNTGTLSVSYTLDVPVWWEKQPTTVVAPGNAVRARCPVGSVDINPLIRVYGPSTGTITGTLRDHRGGNPKTFTLSSLTSSEFVVIDTNKSTIQKVSSGVVGTVPDGYALFGGEYLVLAANDVDRYGAVYPTIEIDDSGHTATVELLYVKAWR